MNEKFDNVITKFKQYTKKECYRVDIIEELPEITDNKIGGKPYLPTGIEYPKDKAGNYMPLLLQINLKDIELDGYPKDGIVEIFTDKDVDYPCQYIVKYFKDRLDYQTEFPEIDSSHYICKDSYKIQLSKDISYMSINDYRFKDTICKIINDEYKLNLKILEDVDNFFECDDWYEEFEENTSNPLITIGGYANFTQTDPREYKIKDKEECLFKLDSYYNSRKFNIGDIGIISALISKDDIKKCNFENTIVDWDCT